MLISRAAASSESAPCTAFLLSLRPYLARSEFGAIFMALFESVGPMSLRQAGLDHADHVEAGLYDVGQGAGLDHRECEVAGHDVWSFGNVRPGKNLGPEP